MDTVGNPRPANIICHLDNGSEPTSPDCTYFSQGNITAEFYSPGGNDSESADVIVETEILDVHLNHMFPTKDMTCTDDEINAIETHVTDNAAAQNHIPQVIEMIRNNDAIEPNSEVNNSTVSMIEGDQNSPHCFDVHPNSSHGGNMSVNKINQVDITIPNDPGTTTSLSDSRRESNFNSMNSDTEINKDIQADYEVSEDITPSFSIG